MNGVAQVETFDPAAIALEIATADGKVPVAQEDEDVEAIAAAIAIADQDRVAVEQAPGLTVEPMDEAT